VFCSCSCVLGHGHLVIVYCVVCVCVCPRFLSLSLLLNEMKHSFLVFLEKILILIYASISHNSNFLIIFLKVSHNNLNWAN
jgi:hypothetical protein